MDKSKSAPASGSNDTQAMPAEEQQFEKQQDIPVDTLRRTANPGEAEITDEPDDVDEQSGHLRSDKNSGEK